MSFLREYFQTITFMSNAATAGLWNWQRGSRTSPAIIVKIARSFEKAEFDNWSSKTLVVRKHPKVRY